MLFDIHCCDVRWCDRVQLIDYYNRLLIIDYWLPVITLAARSSVQSAPKRFSYLLTCQLPPLRHCLVAGFLLPVDSLPVTGSTMCACFLSIAAWGGLNVCGWLIDGR